MVASEDTPNNVVYDKRTPGLFTVEWSQDGFVGLNSKTYHCWGKWEGQVFLQRNQQEKNLITKDKYHKVLKTSKTDCDENRGFRVVNNRVLTYVHFRDGFSYF